MSSTPVVYVIDDDSAVREAMRMLIGSIRLEVETFTSCEKFLDLYDHERNSCVIVDVRLPGMSGFELQEVLAARDSSPPVIMITGYGDVAMAVRAIENGAVDFLTKPFNDQVLLDRISEALSLDTANRERRRRTAALRERYDSLTPREREVMALVVSGRANKAVAADLQVSCKTVEGHRAHVMEKMGADSLAGLVRMGLELGLMGDPPEVPRRRGMWAARGV
jgi:two-component system response regulator FixJ